MYCLSSPNRSELRFPKFNRDSTLIKVLKVREKFCSIQIPKMQQLFLYIIHKQVGMEDKPKVDVHKRGVHKIDRYLDSLHKPTVSKTRSIIGSQ